MKSRILFALLVLIASAGFVLADKTADDDTISIGLSGEVSVSGKFLNVTANLGEGVTRGVRVYSEPSHTPVGVFSNSDTNDEAQQRWLSQEPNAKHVMTIGPFEKGLKAKLQGAMPLETDKQIVVEILGNWKSNNEVTTQKLTVNLPSARKFAFTLTTDRRSRLVILWK